MSYRRKCGCVITDSKNPEVRKGFCVGGSIQSFCTEHDPKNQPKAKPKPTYTELQEQVAALEAALTEVIEAQHSNFIHNCSDDTQRIYAALKQEEKT